MNQNAFQPEGIFFGEKGGLVLLLTETIIFATQTPTMRKVSIGVVQMSCVADKEANLQKAIAGIEKAAAQGAQIVCLQELFTSLYF